MEIKVYAFVHFEESEPWKVCLLLILLFIGILSCPLGSED